MRCVNAKDHEGQWMPGLRAALHCCVADKMSTPCRVDIGHVNRCSQGEREGLNNGIVLAWLSLKLTVHVLKIGCHDLQTEPGF